MPLTRAVALVALMAASQALVACGKKGDPDFPQGTPTRVIEREDGSKQKMTAKPSRPFVLDGLLN